MPLSRSIAKFKGDHLSATMQGCKGDGVTNDSPAMLAAVTEAAVRGSALHLPAGIYRLATPVALPNGAHIYSNGDALIVADTGRAFNFHGTWAGGTTPPVHKHQMELRNLRFKPATPKDEFAVHVLHGDDVTLTRCKAYDCHLFECDSIPAHGNIPDVSWLNQNITITSAVVVGPSSLISSHAAVDLRYFNVANVSSIRSRLCRYGMQWWGGDAQDMGRVSTVGTAVTLTFGRAFDGSLVTRGIWINGVKYTVTAVNPDTLHLTLGESAGTQTDVPYGEGGLNSPRWARDLNVGLVSVDGSNLALGDGGVSVGSAGIWGSCLDGGTIGTVNSRNCGDTSLDFEGCRAISIGNGVIEDGVTGCITLFYINERINFGNLQVTTRTKTHPVFRTFSYGSDYSLSSKGIKFSGTTFTCLDPTGTAAFDTSFGQLDYVEFSGVTFNDVTCDVSYSAPNGCHIDGYIAHFTKTITDSVGPQPGYLSLPVSGALIVTSQQGALSRKTIIKNVTISSDVAQTVWGLKVHDTDEGAGNRYQFDHIDISGFASPLLTYTQRAGGAVPKVRMTFEDIYTGANGPTRLDTDHAGTYITPSNSIILFKNCRSDAGNFPGIAPPLAGEWDIGQEALFDAPGLAGPISGVCTGKGAVGIWRTVDDTTKLGDIISRRVTGDVPVEMISSSQTSAGGSQGGHSYNVSYREVAGGEWTVKAYGSNNAGAVWLTDIAEGNLRLIPIPISGTPTVDQVFTTAQLLALPRITITPSGITGLFPVSDATTLLKNQTDATKLLKIVLNAITTGTTRLLRMPDYDLTVAGTDVANVFIPDQTIRAAGGATSRIRLDHGAAASGANLVIYIESIAGGTGFKIFTDQGGGVLQDVIEYSNSTGLLTFMGSANLNKVNGKLKLPGAALELTEGGTGTRTVPANHSLIASDGTKYVEITSPAVAGNVPTSDAAGLITMQLGGNVRVTSGGLTYANLAALQVAVLAGLTATQVYTALGYTPAISGATANGTTNLTTGATTVTQV